MASNNINTVLTNKFSLFLLAALGLLLMQCRKEQTAPPAETDQLLFAKAKLLTSFTYYKANDSIYKSSPQSAHVAYFRVRFNAIAQAALTDGGKLPMGGSFPTGSLIVKELHQDSLGNSPSGYAIMEKLPNDTTQAETWVWAEYNLSGTGYTINKKGAICTGCHSMNDRDKVRLFNLFP